jgi:hypothetical protein
MKTPKAPPEGLSALSAFFVVEAALPTGIIAMKRQRS